MKPRESKACCACKVEKPADQFYSAGARGGLSARCKECQREYQSRWRRGIPPEHRAKRQQVAGVWKSKHPDYFRDNWLQKRHNISAEEYDRMFEAQSGLCAICGKPETDEFAGKPKRLAVDHDHNTGQIRSLLCGRCNQTIGRLEEDVQLLNRIVEYLTAHKKAT